MKIKSNAFNINSSHIFLWILFYILPFVDELSGYLMLSGIIAENSLASPAQIFRGITFLIEITIIFRYFRTSLPILAIWLWLITLEVVGYILNGTPYGFGFGLVYLNKISFCFATYFALKHYINEGIISIEQLLLFLRNSSIIYSSFIWIQLVTGWGFPTYFEGTFGKRGFVSSVNGLGIYLGVCSVIAYHVFLKNKTITNIIFFLLIFIAQILVGNKGSLFFIPIMLGIIVSRMNFKGKIGFCALLIFVVIINFEKIVTMFNLIFEVIIWRYEKAPNLMAFIFSGRDALLNNALKNFTYAGFKVIRLLTGFGAYISYRDVDISEPLKTIENEPLDIFFMYGGIGTVLYFLILFFGIYQSFKNQKLYFTISLLGISLYSIIAGHIIFNPMACLPLVVLYILAVQKTA